MRTPLHPPEALPEPEPEPELPSKPLAGTKRKSSGATPAKKKTKTPAPVTLHKLLQPLQKPQLEKLVLDFCAQRPEMEPALRHLPGFDYTAALAELQKLLKKVFTAFPHSRWGSSTDHYSYNRVRPVQANFIAAVKKPLTPLSTGKQWKELLEYLIGAIKLSGDLPDWNQEADCKSKNVLFRTLATKEAGQTEGV